MEYQHGGNIYTNQVELDYSVNISPLGMPDGVLQATRDAVSQCSQYPDSQCGALKQALSDTYSIPKEWIVCGNGAADLIFAVVLARKPRKALLLAPTFSEYERALQVVDCQVEHYFFKKEQEFTFDEETWEQYLCQIKENSYDMIFICNPNNPTGAVIDRTQIERAAKLCEERDIALVIDECFCDFLEEEEKVTAVALVETYPNLLLLKAFTKIYAMAGLRLGYGFCSQREWIEQMERVRQPWSVSGIAQAAGIAALNETEYVTQVKSLVHREKKKLEEGLLALGCRVVHGKANYILFEVPSSYQEIEQEKPFLYQAMLERGILIRDCRNYIGLSGGYYRICVGKERENRMLLEAMHSCLNNKKNAKGKQK